MADWQKTDLGRNYPSCAAKYSIGPLSMMLLSRLMVGEVAEYNSACVNTLRRSQDGN